MSTKFDEIYTRLAKRLAWDAAELVHLVRRRLAEDLPLFDPFLTYIPQSDGVARFGYDLETLEKIEPSPRCESVVNAVKRLADIFHECFSRDTEKNDDSRIQDADNRAKMMRLAARAKQFNHAAYDLHCKCDPSANKGLKECEYQAYQAYGVAADALEQNGERQPTDDEAYEWIKERDVPDYNLPAECETYKRHLRNARRHYGTQKKKSRAGRKSRSTVSGSEI